MYETYLQKYFNHAAFRPGQEEIVEGIMNKQDVLALMPTGGGKSLCYQLPAVAGGLFTLVISPLIALMKDQVDSLRARGIRAEYVNSSLLPQEYSRVFQTVRTGACNILYVAPERLQNPDFLRMLSERDVQLLAIDEAHCVSQWGHDFRPDYLRIKHFIGSLRVRPTVAAFTATATPQVKDEIIVRLGLRQPRVCIRGFDRPNLKFFVRSDIKKKDRAREALRIINKIPGNGIVYTITRKAAQETADFLSEHGISAAPYHAGMDSMARTRIQNEFMQNKLKVIVATIAFGMGVDKADIRFVIHAGMPSSLEGYYQEAGRAGRDGDIAYCILMPVKADGALHYHFLQESKQEMAAQGKSWDEINMAVNVRYARLEKMKAYAEAYQCRRKAILEYFSDPDAAQYAQKKCDGCDVCLNYVWNKDGDVADERRNVRRWKTDEEFDDDDELSATVMETVGLYTRGYTPERIARARTMAMSTIFGHLLRWYLSGGNFKIDEFLAPSHEAQIVEVMKKIGEYKKLTPIKQHLPEDISYEQIRMVQAKLRKTV